MNAKSIISKALIVSSVCLTGACASITAGTTQSVGVDTTPKQGAECQLANEKGTWNINSTPGSTTVTKANGPLTASCKTADGWSGSRSVESTTAAASFGNIIAGGIVGAAVDMGTGAAYIYPGQITVSLSPNTGTPEAKTTTLIRCQVKKAELHTDEESCKKAGGKVAALNQDKPNSAG